MVVEKNASTTLHKICAIRNASIFYCGNKHSKRKETKMGIGNPGEQSKAKKKKKIVNGIFSYCRKSFHTQKKKKIEEDKPRNGRAVATFLQHKTIYIHFTGMATKKNTMHKTTNYISLE